MAKFLIVCGGSGIGLLGQRRVLGIDAELQVDVSGEIEESLRKDEKRRADQSSKWVALDRVGQAATARQLITYMHRQHQGASTSSHLQCLSDHWTGLEALSDGLARSPAVGSLAISQRPVAEELTHKLLEMLTTNRGRMIGRDNPLVVWIVSSTAGGTGQGTHRFVAETLIRLFRNQFPGNLPLRLNFVQVGPLTFQSVDIQRTSINTFFGVAADTAFSLRIAREAEYEDSGITVSWFYLDLPDVGKGSEAKALRAKIVEMAVKAIMLDELNTQLNMLTNNDGALMALVRTGFWGYDFNKDLIYLEVLKELETKLKKLVRLDTNLFANQPALHFVQGSEDKQKRFRHLIERLGQADFIRRAIDQQEWKFPRFRESRESARDRLNELITEWRRAIDTLIAPDQLGSFDTRFQYEEVVQDRARIATFAAPSISSDEVSQYNESWFAKVAAAQRVKAQALAELEGSNGLIDKLVQLAMECSNIQHNPLTRWVNSSETKAKQFAQRLGLFVVTFEQVTYLRSELERAERTLAIALAGLDQVLDQVSEQIRIMQRQAGDRTTTRPIVTAELSSRLDHLENRSWLRLLKDAARDRDRFKEEVINGAVGLSQNGLVSVLGLAEHDDIATIHRKLKTGWGQNRYQAEWWQASQPPNMTQAYNYRILPELEASVKASLEQRNQPPEINLVYPNLGAIGLNILAFEGVSISAQADVERTPAYLMRPFVHMVQRAIEDWRQQPNPEPGLPSGKFTIANAGTVGARLYRKALLAAGLSESDVQLLTEFFELYDLPAAFSTYSSPNGASNEAFK